MVKQLLFAHSIPGHPRPLGRPHLTWMVSFEQCFILFCSCPLLFAFVVGGLGFEFCVFVAGWRHALRSEWPFIIIIIIIIYLEDCLMLRSTGVDNEDCA